MTETVTTHDLEANGTKYIVQWTHTEDGNDEIAITEACDEPEEDHDYGHETYDFKQIEG